MLQSSLGWSVRRLEVEAPSGLLPVTALVGGSPPGLPARVYVPKGPACGVDDPGAWAAALAALERLAVQVAAALVVLEPNAVAEETAAIAGHLGGRWEPDEPVQPRDTAVVDLRGGLDAVLARMRPKGRYNARLAERRGVVVTELSDPEQASRVLARLCRATAARQGIHLPGQDHLYRALTSLPAATVLVAEVEGEEASGALVAGFATEAVYLYGGSTERHRELQPSALLHLAAMRWAIGQGCESYDLWGIPPTADPGHPWHGLRRFKLSLGGTERTSAGAWRLVRRPLATRALGVTDSARRGVRRVRLAIQTGSWRRNDAVQSAPVAGRRRGDE